MSNEDIRNLKQSNIAADPLGGDVHMEEDPNKQDQSILEEPAVEEPQAEAAPAEQPAEEKGKKRRLPDEAFPDMGLEPPPTRKKAPAKGKDFGETNLLMIRLLLIGGFLMLGLLIFLTVRLKREGQEAQAYADQLLEAYQSMTPAPTAEPTAEPTATPSADPSAQPAITPEPSATPTATPEAVTETTDPEADAQAMESAGEHRLEDESQESVDEAGDYVQPEAPDVDEAEAIISSVISKVGEDGIIGVIEIPEIDIELPVIGKWSYALLKVSVCRYKGPGMNEKGNLVVIGHNYRSGAHFGNLSELKKGSAVYLTGTDGKQVRYEVYEMQTIEPDAFSALDKYKGTAGLTLMTCKNSGNNRLVVRCVQKEAPLPDAR